MSTRLLIPDTTNSPRLWALDAIRGPAAMLIVAFHSLATVTANHADTDPSMVWVGWLRHGGTLGVSAFIFLSGFGTHFAALQRRGDAISWRNFFARRISRLYPPYFTAIVLGIAFNLAWALARHRSTAGFVPSTNDVCSHLLLVQTLLPDTFYGIIPALWFVGVLAQFYLLYPLFAAWNRRLGATPTMLIVAAITMVARGGCSLLARDVPSDSGWYPVIWMNSPTLWLEWVLGAWAAEKVAQGLVPPVWLGVLALPLALGWIEFCEGRKIVYEPMITILLGLSLVTLGVHVQRRDGGSGTRLLLWLGEISYGVYLLHQIFVPYLGSGIAKLRLPAALYFLMVFAGTCVATFPLAFLVHRYVEDRFGGRTRSSTHRRAMS